VGGVTTLTQCRWKGRHAEIWTYRFASQVPLRSSGAALLVHWFELTITHEKTGDLIFHNAWVTNHLLSSQTVVSLAQAARTRWKVENETINILKNHGYHLEHNFGFDVSSAERPWAKTLGHRPFYTQFACLSHPYRSASRR